MSDVVVRLILVGAVALAAVSLGWLSSWRRRRSHERGSLDGPALFGDIDERVLFFTTVSCPSCDEARRRLIATGALFREISYTDSPDLHAAAGVTGVPLIVFRAVDGGVSARIAGKPALRRLKRLLETTASE